MDVVSRDFFLPSTDGRHSLHAVEWKSEEQPKAVLQIIHGMCEYIRRYEDFASFMAKNGFVVVGHDHVGHGETEPDANERGYFAKEDGWKLLVDDAYAVTRDIKERYADLPLFVLGHSMGSFVLKNYLTYHGSELSGALISGTGGPNPLGGVGIMLTRVIQFFKGDHHRSKLIDNIAFGSYCKNIENCRTEKDWLTHDAAVVDRYRKDEYCMFTFTVSGFRDLFLSLKYATQKDWEKGIAVDLPVLYFAGEEDPVGGYGQGVKTVYERLKEAGHPDLELKLYSKMRHETHNEIGKEQVYADLLDWMTKRIK